MTGKEDISVYIGIVATFLLVGLTVWEAVVILSSPILVEGTSGLCNDQEASKNHFPADPEPTSESCEFPVKPRHGAVSRCHRTVTQEPEQGRG